MTTGRMTYYSTGGDTPSSHAQSSRVPLLRTRLRLRTGLHLRFARSRRYPAPRRHLCRRQSLLYNLVTKEQVDMVVHVLVSQGSDRVACRFVVVL
jgi:hypothetical protein